MGFRGTRGHGKIVGFERPSTGARIALPHLLTLPVPAESTSRPALLRTVALSLAGSLLLAVSAHLAVPFWPVPMTLQTLVVLLLGTFMGPVAAIGAVLAYVAEGLVGLPVFANGGGVGALMGPTFGYIVGFVPAAFIASLAGRWPDETSPLATAALLVVADSVILACGVAWLATLIGWDRAVAVGLTPFLLGEALKITLAIVAVQLRPARP